MSESRDAIADQLRDAAGAQRPVRVERDHKWWAADVYGLVASVTSRWVVIQALQDAVYLDGYEVVRIKDITGVEDNSESGYIERAVVGLGHPEADFQLPEGASTGDVLRAAANHSAVVSVFIEKKDDRARLIGDIHRLGEKEFDIQLIGPKGVWEVEPIRERYKDVTRVSFGDRYSAALERFGETRPALESHEPHNLCSCD